MGAANATPYIRGDARGNVLRLAALLAGVPGHPLRMPERWRGDLRRMQNGMLQESLGELSAEEQKIVRRSYDISLSVASYHDVSSEGHPGKGPIR